MTTTRRTVRPRRGAKASLALIFVCGCGSSGARSSPDAATHEGGGPTDARVRDSGDAIVHPSDSASDASSHDAGADSQPDALAEAGAEDVFAPDGAKDASRDATDSGFLDATLTVERATKLGSIGAGFAGLSYEKAHLNDGFFTSTNTDLIGLFTRLGPSVLRIGGNSVDKTTWDATGAGNTVGVIAPADVKALAGFLAATGWTVIYGVNMAADDPTTAAAEATYAASVLGSSLYGFEIGNECDEYANNGDRPTTWTYADFFAQWKTFYAPMHAGAPHAAFTGPASAANHGTYTVPFATDAAADIVLLTQHYYRGNGQSASSTLAELLEPDPNLLTLLEALGPAATTNHLARGYRLAEANSFYNGGAPGVSNGFGTALWAVDFLYTNATYGSAGVNFHGGGNGDGYTPIADLDSVVQEARPDYYGMFLFTLAGQGTMFGTELTLPAINFTAYAVGPTDGSTNLVLVNKDASATVQLTIDVGIAATTAETTLLTGPALASTTGFTIGGVPVNKDGTWTPVATPALAVTDMKLTVEAPPASALLVHVH